MVSAFLCFSYIPLSYHSTWVHVAQGQALLEHGLFYSLDATQPLASSVPYYETSWLSNLTLYGLSLTYQGEPLSWAVSICLMLTCLMLARMAWNLSKRYTVVVFSVAAFLGLVWFQLGIASPAMFGILFFVGLIWLLQSFAKQDNLTIWQYVAVLSLMIVWVNFDASVIFGVLYLISLALGEIIDSLVETRGSFNKTFNRKSVRSRVWLAELAVLATLCSPLGLSFWHLAVSSGNTSLWASFGGYRPVLLGSILGGSFAISLATYATLIRLSSAKISATEIISVLVFAVLLVFNQALILWFAPVVLLPIIGHWVAILGVGTPEEKAPELKPGEEPQPLRFAYTLVCALLLWIGFALSPISIPVLGGKPREFTKIYAPSTPHVAANYLQANPTYQLVFAPADWSDWLSFAGPQGTQMFATSRFHLLPKQAQFDYDILSRGARRWEEVADRYGIQTIMIDKSRQRGMLASAKDASDNWSVALEDDSILVLKRRAS